LNGDPCRRSNRFYLKAHRRYRTSGKRDQSRRTNLDLLLSRRYPINVPSQYARPKIKDTLVLNERPVANIEWFIINEQAEQLAIRHVDQRLILLWITVRRLGV
jgi:hypothetical protein